MNLLYHGRRITGVLTVVPQKVSNFDDEAVNYSFPIEKTLRLKSLMGFKEHRIVDDGTCVSDLCVYGLQYLFDQGLVLPQDIDALVLVTQSPDYFMPPTSNVIQGRLGLKEDMICLDVNQGCAAFEVGLFIAFSLLDQESIHKVALLNAEVLSRKVSKQDRNSFPLIGDAASITLVEKDFDQSPIYANIMMDGSKREALMIPAGGFRLPCSQDTAIPHDDGTGNLRSLENLRMNGQDVFNFVMEKVPPMISSLLDQSGKRLDDVNYFLFHQPNKFMLEKLAEKLGVSYKKMPSNIVERFGNSSGVTIPTNICYNIGERVLNEEFIVCFAGFGSGLTWSSILMKIGNMKFCKMIEF